MTTRPGPEATSPADVASGRSPHEGTPRSPREGTPRSPREGTPDAATRGAAVRALEASFAGLFTQLRDAYARAAASVSPGMMPGTFKVFTTIERMGPVTLSAVAELMQADKGMLSRAVSELESLGFVERSPDPSDGRMRLIAVTDLGRSRLEAVRYPYIDRLGEALADWPVDSIEKLTDMLNALATGITPEP
ncbi:MarR family winged helix-turn-helix transcriptional regulator [Microbacterium luticocti]|uniref:MarR family winged helix-turn-helix transcriptional regulator n=1 Tax=Microbacterium luticocti TaxID=451764 RepID=UPI0009FDAF8F|nr:MarR family winged helix-turn-helix transcriptional regulator [Microbacterium luticocti]